MTATHIPRESKSYYVQPLFTTMREFMQSKNPHPWANFLNARREAMLWMREKFNYCDQRIAEEFTMDTMQVTLILMDRNYPIPDGKGTNEKKYVYLLYGYARSFEDIIAVYDSEESAQEARREAMKSNTGTCGLNMLIIEKKVL